MKTLPPHVLGVTLVELRPGLVALVKVDRCGTGPLWTWCIWIEPEPHRAMHNGLATTAEAALADCRQVLSRLAA